MGELPNHSKAEARRSRALALGTAMPAQEALGSLLLECLQWNDVEKFIFSFREMFFLRSAFFGLTRSGSLLGVSHQASVRASYDPNHKGDPFRTAACYFF